MSFWQSRASYRPLGRQPLRPGQWQGYKGMSKNTTYIQNNFFGGGYGGGYNYNSCFSYGNFNNYGNYGCNCGGGGGNKWMNWMLGIGVGSSLLGAIFNMFGIGGGNKNDDINADDGSKTRTNKENQNNGNIDETKNDDGKKEVDNKSESNISNNNNRKKEEVPPDILTVKKEEVKTTTNYPVKYGDTWTNIITAKYKDENGNPIRFTDAQELWTKLKEECGASKNADGMPPSIELPNKFKNYKLDINGEVTANKDFKKSNYKGFDGKGFTEKTTTSLTATGTVNGKPIGTVSGSEAEVTAQLKEKGFSEKDINEAIKNGEVKITRQSEE